jgi:hypothetical protein
LKKVDSNPKYCARPKGSRTPQKWAKALIFIGFLDVSPIAKMPFYGYNISYFKPRAKAGVSRVPETSQTLSIKPARPTLFCGFANESHVFANERRLGWERA